MIAKTLIFLCLNILLISICIIGDNLTNILPSNTWTKAVIDNAIHGLLGFISWFIVLFPVSSKRMVSDSMSAHVFQSLICVTIACAIDIDHFVHAKSFDLQDVVTLSSRPFLHCTTVPIVMLVILLLYGRLKSSRMLILLAWLIFVAFISHHLRDSTRRGLWFFYFGSTEPLPYNVYLSAQIMLPLSVKYCLTNKSQ
ncbi:C5orf28 (predicted) [Pycnogonum litorale]